MRIGSLTVDAVVDGETTRTLSACYPSVSAQELDTYRRFVTDEDILVMTIGGHLIRGEGRTILVDAGIGDAPVPPSTGGALRSSLYALGVSPNDVTDVIFTHLHSDHIGWATRQGRPFFRNATYRCDRRDWEYFMSPAYITPEWEHRMTRPEADAAQVRLAPIADQMEFWEGDTQILPGMQTVDAAGHTPGSVALLLSSEGEQGMLLGDIVHSVPELLTGWRFAVHTDADTAVTAVRRIRNYLASERIPCSAAHFTGMRWGRVVRDGELYRWKQLD